MRVSDVDSCEEEADPLHSETGSKNWRQTLGDAHHFIGHLGPKVVVEREMLSRNYEDVPATDWTDVQEGDDVVGLIDDTRRHLASCYTAEQALEFVHVDAS